MVDRSAGVAMSSSRFASFKKLHLTGHRRIGKTAGGGIDVAEQTAIVGIAVAVGHRAERRMGFLPGVTKRYAAGVLELCFHRPGKPHTAQGFAGPARDR